MSNACSFTIKLTTEQAKRTTLHNPILTRDILEALEYNLACAVELGSATETEASGNRVALLIPCTLRWSSTSTTETPEQIRLKIFQYMKVTTDTIGGIVVSVSISPAA